MKRNSHSKKTRLFILFVIALLFISCNSNKLTADYPNIKSVYHKKSEISLDKRKKINHTKSTVNAATLVDAPSKSLSESTSGTVDTTFERSEVIASKSKPKPSIRRFILPISEYKHELLTASLSNEPFIAAHTYRPDTTTLTEMDSTGNKDAQTQSPVVSNNEKVKMATNTNREPLAIISPIAALLAVATFFLTLPGLTILFIVGAIVFGALGLKSKRRNLAVLGLTLGIVFSLIILIALIAFLMNPVVVM